MRPTTGPLLACLLTFSVAATAPAAGQDWQFSLTPYAWVANLDGRVGVRGLDAEVDASFGDLLDNAELAAAARFEAYRGDWLIAVDGFFFGAGVATARPPASVDVDSLLGEVAVGYRLSQAFAVTFGARFFSLDTTIDFRGPAGIRVAGDQDWVDPIVGFRAGRAAPGGGIHWLLIGDVGGFGAGSDFSWNLAGFLLIPAGGNLSFALGFRILDVDYEDGAGTTRFRYDIQQAGPFLGITFHF